MNQLAPTGRLGVYLHVPFCLRRCPYCDFTVAVMRNLPESDFVEAMLRELAQRRDAFTGRRLSTIYFGGGTPSLLSVAALARLLEEAQHAQMLTAFACDAYTARLGAELRAAGGAPAAGGEGSS